MQCTQCGGRLEGTMTFCPFCGVRPEVDLQQIHFRDLGEDAMMACPQCETPLAAIEFDTEPKLRIERCKSCHGMFFNPGELEVVLEARTHPLVWLDEEQLNQIEEDFQGPREVVYRKCPTCAERMTHVNFGRRSGVILDRCGQHGYWMEGSRLRRLAEWWRAGGKLLYQENAARQVALIRAKTPESDQPRTPGGFGPTWGGVGDVLSTEVPMSLLLDVVVKAICRL
jgi:Zn-finger nucleic acid-binding protein